MSTEYEAGISPPYSAEFKKLWVYISNTAYIFIVWELIRSRYQLSFTFH
jgi:hypothetical protein